MAGASNEETDYDELVKIQRLKAAIHYTVGSICKECEEDDDVNVTFNRQFIAALSEATFRYAQTMARDIELFAKHAKRTQVNCDDVLMLARKSPSLDKYMRDFAEQKLTATKDEQATKKKKSKVSKAAAKVNDDASAAEESNM